MYLGTAIAAIIGYLFGSISWSIVIVWLKSGKDVRKHGSKNAGATNASRILGKKWGLVIVVLDALKVVLAAIIAMGLNAIPNDLFNKTNMMIPAFTALIGHCYPIFYKFKGGKAVSCFLALALLSNVVLFGIFIVMFLLVAFITRKVSPASIIAATFIAGLCFVPQLYGLESYIISGPEAFNFLYHDKHLYLNFSNQWHDWNIHNGGVTSNGLRWYESILSYQIIVLLGAAVLIFKHKQNISRLFQGIEPEFFDFGHAKRVHKRELAAAKQTEKDNHNDNDGGKPDTPDVPPTQVDDKIRS